ncbi:PREDICTED: uncharacterized protein LOC104764020 isoform X2 [Camelina sativa]|uniref:Uncharacterized protein LOC104764020 isoform X1 n=1 Tax=Camelina sativa TaxID=90675 RepID=A0ABM0XGR0_CAMSA|nr:PREDICTED: uncharacterized protein LOC104764020 isoform X1 [Camelina sativa]XP_010485747.1 PREDICTED: uncharacterized protein LOC104764020 isoform X2 [Camelina sativa]
MDLEDWELLSNSSFKELDHEEDHHGAMVMDYFLCPSTKDPLHETESSPRSIMVPKKLVQVPIAWEPLLVVDQDNTKIPNNPDLEPDPYPDSKQTLSADSVSSPRVSFKITKETEFADMKIDPPARITSPLPQIDDTASKPSGSEGGDDLGDKKELILKEEDNDGERLNLWKVGLNGVGAICSFGVAAAAATVCVFFLGHNNIKISKNKNQLLRFQIYSDDNKMQRMKEVVNHATKINEAIFGTKGVPVVRAQISFGGYYDGI